jgi:hypothetical protein
MDYNERLRTRLDLLQRELKAGKIKFGSPLAVESLKKVRVGPDGKIDLDTVDGVVRSMALAIEGVKVEELLKDNPLKQIQLEYFELLEKAYGSVYRNMQKWNLNPHQAAMSLANVPENVQTWIYNRDKERDAIVHFWSAYGAIVHLHLSRLAVLKAVFGGDMGPSYKRNIACSIGLYMDTIVFPDPWLKTVVSLSIIDPKQQFYYAVKHALNILSYKSLAMADLQPPIIVIAPDLSHLTGSDALQKLAVHAGPAILEHAKRVFGRRFRSYESFEKFVFRLRNMQQITTQIKSPSHMLFDAEDKRPLAKQLPDYLYPKYLPSDVNKMSPGEMILRAIQGRMMQAGEIISKSESLDGTPLIDAPTSWQYLLWRYEYEQRLQSKHLVVSKAIQLANRQSVLMMRAKPDTLIELRKKGVLEEMRQLLTAGIHSIQSANENDLKEVVKTVVQNLKTAFEAHKRALEDVKRRRKGLLISSSKSLVMNGLTIAGAATGDIGMSVIGAIGSAIGVKGFMELNEERRRIREENVRYRSTATGIFFESDK